MVCQERLVEVRFAEDRHVVACVKFHRALEVALVELAIRLRALKLHALRMDGPVGAAAADGDNPCEQTSTSDTGSG
jgi:hypothetical protein